MTRRFGRESGARLQELASACAANADRLRSVSTLDADRESFNRMAADNWSEAKDTLDELRYLINFMSAHALEGYMILDRTSDTERLFIQYYDRTALKLEPVESPTKYKLRSERVFAAMTEALQIGFDVFDAAILFAHSELRDVLVTGKFYLKTDSRDKMLKQTGGRSRQGTFSPPDFLQAMRLMSLWQRDMFFSVATAKVISLKYGSRGVLPPSDIPSICRSGNLDHFKRAIRSARYRDEALEAAAEGHRADFLAYEFANRADIERWVDKR